MTAIVVKLERRRHWEQLHLAAGDPREIYWHSRGVVLTAPGGTKLLREVRSASWSMGSLHTALRILANPRPLRDIE